MYARTPCDWKLRTRTLALGRETRVMGILNVTPDSFSDGGRLRSVDEAVAAALRLFEEGAAIVDIGGESTRPGATPLTPGDETGRILPVIDGILRAHPEALLSVDTYHAATARAAVEAGAEIVNDVSGLLWDSEMASTCAALACGVVLMHARGRPTEWASLPRLEAAAVVPLVREELAARRDAALAAGIAPERIVLDPGFGFGKLRENNYTLLAGLPKLAALGHPLLAGLSRKGFLGHTLAPLYGGSPAPADARDAATLAATTMTLLLGASIVRVHRVRETVEAALVADAMLAAG